MKNFEQITYSRVSVLLIIIGVLLGLDNYLDLALAADWWPLFVLTTGLGFIGIYRQKKLNGSLYLGIGVYLICFSVLAMICNFTSWNCLAFWWPLFIAFWGIAQLTVLFCGSGDRLLLFTSLMLISVSVLFFLIFTYHGQFWWLIFVMVGLSILLSGKKYEK